ncbi:MAG: hypothetical protein JST81_15720 [Bacteroidetes bacterium]|jgi:hypothetical protein|nr:hypothetical protein [Bacteroidota bacterium]
MQAGLRALVPVILLFSILILLCIGLSPYLAQYNIDKNVLIAANILFLLISYISFSIQKKAMSNTNPHVFVRSVSGAMMLKMLFCIIALVIYIFASGDAFNKRAVFISLFLYLLYLFVEVMIVMKLNKKRHV